MSRKQWIAAIAGLLVLVLGGRMVLRYFDWEASEAQRNARIDAARLQGLAAAACSCTRTKGKSAENACWKEFRAATLGPSKGGDVTACAPVSTQTECFATKSGEVCVVTGYDANGVSDPTLDTRLCTAAEAQAVEQASHEAWVGPDGKAPDPDDTTDWDASSKRVGAAINRVVRRIMNGESVAPAGPISGGCTG